MTVATTDGESVWAFRYSSEGKSRSLFFSTAVATLREQYPDNPILHQVSDETRLVVSEPLGDLAGRLERGAGVDLRRHPGGPGRAAALHAEARLDLGGKLRGRRLGARPAARGRACRSRRTSSRCRRRAWRRRRRARRRTLTSANGRVDEQDQERRRAAGREGSRSPRRRPRACRPSATAGGRAAPLRRSAPSVGLSPRARRPGRAAPSGRRARSRSGTRKSERLSRVTTATAIASAPSSGPTLSNASR